MMAVSVGYLGQSSNSNEHRYLESEGQYHCLILPRALLLNARCSRRFAKGGWKYGQMRGYTTAGAGTSPLDGPLSGGGCFD